MRPNRRILGIAVACGALVAPAAAGAKPTKTVNVGPGGIVGKVAKSLGVANKLRPLNPDVNAFFIQRTTINVGGTVSFKFFPNGFHTVDIPAKGGSDLPLLLPGATVGTVNDAAGSPFWFSGQVPQLGLNPALLGPTKTTYTGAARVDSGLPLGKPKPFNVTFTKPGVYKFYCDVHAGMVGYVVVKPKGAPIPTAKQDAAAELRQATAAVKGAAKLLKIKQPADTVSLGESTPQGVELYSMFPSSLTVKAGTVVTFQMSKYTEEVHTASFGPKPYLTKLANGFNAPTFPPAGTYPSSPPGAPLTGSLTSHGNGFFNTGVLDQDRNTAQIFPSARIDFTQPGTYHFICLIHPFMHGTIIVK